MAISLAVSGTIQISDPLTGTLTVSKTLSQAFDGTVCSQGEAVKFGTSPTTVTLPISPTQIVYIANLSQTATVTVTWTPTGGSSATVTVLQPLAALLSMESNTTSGITALSITASGANTPVDYLLAG